MLTSNYIELSPTQYGTMQYVHNHQTGEIMFGYGLKETVSGVWDKFKPHVKNVLDDKEKSENIDKIACAGASKLSKLGRDKLQKLLTGGCNTSSVNIGSGMKQSGRGVRHLL
jgi:hypothetical protein